MITDSHVRVTKTGAAAAARPGAVDADRPAETTRPAAAGGFGDPQHVAGDDREWVVLDTVRMLSRPGANRFMRHAADLVATC